MTVADLIREDVVAAGADASVGDLVRQMHDSAVGSVVVTEDARPTGIVTLDDPDVLVKEQERLAAVVEAESPPY